MEEAIPSANTFWNFLAEWLDAGDFEGLSKPRDIDPASCKGVSAIIRSSSPEIDDSRGRRWKLFS
jgi:hypothetical protein